jgi:phenylacetate-CoA ligase
VVHDALFRDSGRATRLFSQQLCGFPLGTILPALGFGARPVGAAGKARPPPVANLLGEIPMNAFRAEKLAGHLQTMLSHPDVQYLMAYVDAAASLAMFVEDRRLPCPKLKAIMACAGTVTPQWRELLQRVFGAEVFDKYGSRECADIASECSAHCGLRVFAQCLRRSGRSRRETVPAGTAWTHPDYAVE